jgi:hypothetical protein
MTDRELVARRARAGNILDTTHFMGVHLDISSKSNLETLQHAFGKDVCVLYVRRENRIYKARVVIGRTLKSPESTIAALCNAVRDLPQPERKLWNGAKSRTFDIGIEAEGPACYWFALTPRTLKAVVGLDAQIVVTVYGPLKTDEQKRKRGAKRVSISQVSAARPNDLSYS